MKDSRPTATLLHLIAGKNVWHAELHVLEEVCALKTIRVKFKKGSSVKFISHLDMMNVFSRAIRRAGLKAEYSKGFNPQMIMVFGAPLSLGYTSDSEYADLTFAEDYSPEHILKTLGNELPPGLELIGAAERTVKKNIMSDVSYAIYEFDIECPENITDSIDHIMTLSELFVEKTRKGKTKTVDIKPLIVSFVIENKKGVLTAKAGNSGNLNPALLAKALSDKTGGNVEFRNIKRCMQFVSRNGKMVEPISSEAVGAV